MDDLILDVEVVQDPVLDVSVEYKETVKDFTSIAAQILTERVFEAVTVDIQNNIIDVDIAERGIKGDPGYEAASHLKLNVIAAQQILAYRAVTLDDEGFAVYANSDIPEHVGKVLGITMQAAPNVGDFIDVMTAGFLRNPGWNWETGKLVFLGLDGTLTQVPIGRFTLSVGYASATDEIHIRIGRGVMRAQNG